jgi:hypothetical protein
MAGCPNPWYQLLVTHSDSTDEVGLFCETCDWWAPLPDDARTVSDAARLAAEGHGRPNAGG